MDAEWYQDISTGQLIESGDPENQILRRFIKTETYSSYPL